MRPSIRLSQTHRWSLYAVWSVISASGLYFAYSQDWKMQIPTDLTVDTLKIHGIFAMFMLLIIGSLWSMHIRMSLHRKRNILSGMSILSIMLLLAFSGTGLYYSPENWHEMVKWLHIWVGVISVVFLPIHIIIGRLSRKRRNMV